MVVALLTGTLEPVTAAVSTTEADAAEDPVFDQALSSLPAGAREVLRLWAWEDLAPREIALERKAAAVSGLDPGGSGEVAAAQHRLAQHARPGGRLPDGPRRRPGRP